MFTLVLTHFVGEYFFVLSWWYTKLVSSNPWASKLSGNITICLQRCALCVQWLYVSKLHRNNFHGRYYNFSFGNIITNGKNGLPSPYCKTKLFKGQSCILWFWGLQTAIRGNQGKVTRGREEILQGRKLLH